MRPRSAIAEMAITLSILFSKTCAGSRERSSSRSEIYLRLSTYQLANRTVAYRTTSVQPSQTAAAAGRRSSCTSLARRRRTSRPWRSNRSECLLGTSPAPPALKSERCPSGSLGRSRSAGPLSPGCPSRAPAALHPTSLRVIPECSNTAVSAHRAALQAEPHPA